MISNDKHAACSGAVVDVVGRWLTRMVQSRELLLLLWMWVCQRCIVARMRRVHVHVLSAGLHGPCTSTMMTSLRLLQHQVVRHWWRWRRHSCLRSDDRQVAITPALLSLIVPAATHTWNDVPQHVTLASSLPSSEHVWRPTSAHCPSYDCKVHAQWFWSLWTFSH